MRDLDDAQTCGRLHDPCASPMLDDPRPLYARARREEPIYWSDRLNLWVATRYEDVRAIARDEVPVVARGGDD